MEELSGETSRDFIRQVIDEDLKTGKYGGRVHTRFPPEPTGYLHIGHAKAIMLNYGIAEEYGGLFNLRFDDTNPVGEEGEFVEAIIEDAKWLGADWGERLFFASDYFDKMYEYAVQLVKQGDAYVDDLSSMEIKHYRGNVVKPGQNSPHRDRPIEENLDLLERMKAGEFKDGERVLRAKIDMAHPNMNMRDPLIYRILHATHHNTGDRWCIYPMYDWAHGLEDSIEGITHSLCSIEFENHRPLYDWFLIKLGVYRPQQIEFARLNLTSTVMSKRWLKQLVEEGHVSGWDDPRMPTVRGMRRRGYTAEAIRDFLNRVGIAKKANTIAIELLEHCVREHLNRVAPRFMGVLNPLKIVIENYPEDNEEEMDAVNNPEDPSMGSRKLPFSRELYIERDDFMEDPPKKFYRLAPGREVRFRYAYFVTCNDVIKENGEVTELRCTIDPDTRGGDSSDGRKVKSTLHWVSARHAIDAEVRLYDKLFTVEDPAGQEGDFKEYINKDSLQVLKNCKVESAVGKLSPGERFQFERLGYFCIDPDTAENNVVINRTVTLKDSWAKIQQQQSSG